MILAFTEKINAMNQDHLIELIAKEIDGNLNDSEKVRLEKFMKDSEENRKLADNARNLFAERKFPYALKNPDQIYERIVSRCQIQNESMGSFNHARQHRIRLGATLLKVAASVVLILGIVFVGYHFLSGTKSSDSDLMAETVIKHCPKGRKLTVKLPDGSQVKLNAETIIEYDKGFRNGRKVKLIGEAYFDIKHDPMNPFVVEASNLDITVLGTSFNVTAYPFEKSISVSVVSGKVRVNERTDSAAGKNNILTKDQKIQFEHATREFRSMPFNYDQEVGWTSGILYFKDASFDEIVKKLERWYGVEFVIERDKPIKTGFSGRYENATLKEVLIGMGFASDFKYHIENDTVYIY